MEIALSPEEMSLQQEARAVLSEIAADEDPHDLHDEYGEVAKRVARRLGAAGLLGVSWPKEHGGRELSPFADQIVLNEACRFGVPYPIVTVTSVGPSIQMFGTPEQREAYLPGILAGELWFTIGYTEPAAGSDVAAVRTKAHRDGDEYVVSGQKIFSSGMHSADFMWLACRTAEPGARRHDGISILIVDATAPGLAVTPIPLASGIPSVNATYFDDVRVPASSLVGEEGRGWRVMMSQLNRERYAVGLAGKLLHYHERTLDWVRQQVDADGRPLGDVPAVRRTLGRTLAATTANRLLNWRLAAPAADERTEAANGSVNKVYNSERVFAVGQEVAELVQRFGDPGDAVTAELLAEIDLRHKTDVKLTVGGGVNEVQRELIATLGVGLPRGQR